MWRPRVCRTHSYIPFCKYHMKGVLCSEDRQRHRQRHRLSAMPPAVPFLARLTSADLGATKLRQVEVKIGTAKLRSVARCCITGLLPSSSPPSPPSHMYFGSTAYSWGNISRYPEDRLPSPNSVICLQKFPSLGLHYPVLHPFPLSNVASLSHCHTQACPISSP